MMVSKIAELNAGDNPITTSLGSVPRSAGPVSVIETVALGETGALVTGFAGPELASAAISPMTCSMIDLSVA